MKVPLSTLRNPMTRVISYLTEGDGESPRKKKPWDFEKEKENTMTFTRIHFEAIREGAQKNWKVPDKMAKYGKKYLDKYVSGKEVMDNITLNSPVTTNSPKAKIMDD